MESQPESKDCCSHKSHCSGCKAVAALVLLLIGGIVGFLAARPCSHHSVMCPVHEMGMMGMPKGK